MDRVTWNGCAWSQQFWALWCTCCWGWNYDFTSLRTKITPFLHQLAPPMKLDWMQPYSILFFFFNLIFQKTPPLMSHNWSQQKEFSGTILTASSKTESWSSNRQTMQWGYGLHAISDFIRYGFEAYQGRELFWLTIIAKYSIKLSKLGHDYSLSRSHWPRFVLSGYPYVRGHSTTILPAFIHLSQQIRNWYTFMRDCFFRISMKKVRFQDKKSGCLGFTGRNKTLFL